ncbi:hypothetical protein MTX26_01730 [Bradyrhizobium sp. ISRA443]|uniref:cold-shock protein n=1 Tax=unclassified Bradyrhizobium TaxID=2631580 RepID=UPI00247A80FB|nr:MULTISPECIES: hypothetical protein [unclassified Bradyrhizobium]WGR94790.1 hypothetical protein MTX20_11770 [Bradyrhizobium sp. ISRA435]WGR99619.1 hypothetical protein MTX23_01730 [Bradyrhizobium sp. ISRA436]WGS06509.1 hypothetical protein MTX18_01730 [Bradyrhizobium sp. ISRA437]WGS13393.1 hypothetical protein MTX26_01730 [Bradyrhizobium sp. ISRA443]
MRATLTRWLPEKRYGFAKAAGLTHDLMVHVADIVSGAPYAGAVIECDIVKGDRHGRPRAANVRVLQ